MIVNTKFDNDCIEFCKDSPFGCRIFGINKSYGDYPKISEFWKVFDDNHNLIGVIGRIDSQIILHIRESVNLKEVSEFIQMISAKAILCDGNISLTLPNFKTNSGVVMKFENSYKNVSNTVINNPPARTVYKLLKSCKSDTFFVPEFEDFYLDYSHKMRHECVRSTGIYNENELVAFAMTAAESYDSAVVAAVCVHPEFRNKGFGSQVVSTLVNELTIENKYIYIFRSKNENEDFYKKLGFCETGMWSEYTRI
ncbi:MAG: GNAT family N-acetyltransferase [Bacillota bacterium]|nr:GNAT family N-acetyltransferase [Bacillota bacterium]